MSGAFAGLSLASNYGMEALGSAGLLPALIRAPRSIGTIIPDVTIEEQHTDRLQVTQHPIAQGSPISDHAFMMPAQVTMRVGWTNANPVGATIQGLMSGGLLGAGEGLLGAATEQRVKDIYQQLLTLQYDRDAAAAGGEPVTPFTLTTGKRTYDNMVIAELGVRTDHTTEYSLMIECHMQEVFIVDTQETTQPAQDAQAAPQDTQATTPTPDKQPDAPKGPGETPFAAAKDYVTDFFKGMFGH